MYALAKKGARNVDVITNGVSIPWGTQNEEQLAFLEPFLSLNKHQENSPKKWLDVLRSVERAQGCTYLLNVANIQ